MNDQHVDITVILCTFNRCRLLRVALESVAASTTLPGLTWEVLVVDNNSTDHTRQVVEEFCLRNPERFRYLFEPKPGKSHALNAGIEAAKGNFLEFLDDDVTVAPEWLQNLTVPLLGGQFVGAGGRVIAEWSTPPPNWITREGWAVTGPLVTFDLGDQDCPLNESPVGTNMAFHRRVFEQYGGFRVDLGPSPMNQIRNEDSEFVRRLFEGGERLFYVPSAVVYHPVTEDRLTKQYFLAWWFDKGCSEVRESGKSWDANWMIRGVPANALKRITRWTIQWIFTLNPCRRFDCKLKAWYTAGIITECHRNFQLQKVARRVISPQRTY